MLEEIVGHLAVMRIPGEVEERASPDKMFWALVMLDIAFVADLYEFSGHFSTSEDFFCYSRNLLCVGALSSKINNCCGYGDCYSFC